MLLGGGGGVTYVANRGWGVLGVYGSWKFMISMSPVFQYSMF